MTPSRVERRDRAKPAYPPNPPGFERRQREEYRVFLGREWSKGWLAFETHGEKRRLAAYPENWNELRPSELERLCGEAVEVSPPRRLVE